MGFVDPGQRGWLMYRRAENSLLMTLFLFGPNPILPSIITHDHSQCELK